MLKKILAPYLSMPGNSFNGISPEFSTEEEALADTLENHIKHLCLEIGERNLNYYGNLMTAAGYLEEVLKKSGLPTMRQTYEAVPAKRYRYRFKYSFDRKEYHNIIAELRGTSKPEEIIVIGAHYDSYPKPGCLGADDNASGSAAVLSLASILAESNFKRTIRFVLFTNEEPPFFKSPGMGSYVYALECRKKNENITAMLTPETLAFYSDEDNTQNYPFPFGSFYPSKGNFVAFIGSGISSGLLRKCIGIFRESIPFPSEGAVLPVFIPRVDSSDHSSFRRMGYPGVMITDTAIYRNKAYHTEHDSPDRLDYEKTARVVKGLEIIVRELADE